MEQRGLILYFYCNSTDLTRRNKSHYVSEPFSNDQCHLSGAVCVLLWLRSDKLLLSSGLLVSRVLSGHGFELIHNKSNLSGA